MSLLVLIRHGQSQWNLENRFTGWVDIDITTLGEQENRAAGEKVKSTVFSKAFTSDLKRAYRSLEIILKEIGQTAIPVERNAALNERHYGDLQGLNKAEAAKQFGESQVRLWRRSFDITPPGGESLKDTANRVLPYFRSRIAPEVRAGHNVLVVAHGNTLRSIIMDLDKLTPTLVENLNIETGAVIVYESDSHGRFVRKEV